VVAARLQDTRATLITRAADASRYATSWPDSPPPMGCRRPGRTAAPLSRPIRPVRPHPP